MAKKSTLATSKSGSPADDSQKKAETDGSAVTKVMSKSDAARAAIKHGIENPTEASEFILKKFGIEISPSHFSAVKSLDKKATGPAPATKGKPGRKPKVAKKPVEGYLAPPPKQTDKGDLLDAIEAMKPLVASLGADKVKRIVDLLG